MYLMCGPRQLFFQRGPERSKGWTPLPSRSCSLLWKIASLTAMLLVVTESPTPLYSSSVVTVTLVVIALLGTSIYFIMPSSVVLPELLPPEIHPSVHFFASFCVSRPLFLPCPEPTQTSPVAFPLEWHRTARLGVGTGKPWTWIS